MYTEKDWEMIDSAGTLFRLSVPGGWLVKHMETVLTEMINHELQTGYEWRTSIAFVPDENHEWRVEE